MLASRIRAAAAMAVAAAVATGCADPSVPGGNARLERAKLADIERSAPANVTAVPGAPAHLRLPNLGTVDTDGEVETLWQVPPGGDGDAIVTRAMALLAARGVRFHTVVCHAPYLRVGRIWNALGTVEIPSSWPGAARWRASVRVLLDETPGPPVGPIRSPYLSATVAVARGVPGPRASPTRSVTGCGPWVRLPVSS